MTDAAAEPTTDELAEPIVAERLSLVLVPADVLRATAVAPGEAAVDIDWPGVGVIPPELSATMPVAMRLRQVEADPSVAAWLVRGVVVDDPTAPTGARVVGHLGGHDRPAEDGMVECGYTIAADERGRGLATEGAAAWFAWAHRHGALVAQLSIEPGNEASLAVARHLGLEPADRVWDEDDQVWEVVLRAPLPLAAPVADRSEHHGGTIADHAAS